VSRDRQFESTLLQGRVRQTSEHEPSKRRRTCCGRKRAASGCAAIRQMLRAQRRCAEAIPEFEAAIALNHNAAGAYAHLGRWKLLTGSLEEVVPLVQQAIRLSPRDHNLGYWYNSIGLTHLLQLRMRRSSGSKRRAAPIRHTRWSAAILPRPTGSKAKASALPPNSPKPAG
jgi:tetratricopeptide (TPR) repeat protein